MSSNEILKIISYVLFGLSGAGLIVSLVIFFKFRIIEVVQDLSGKLAQKSILKIREQTVVERNTRFGQDILESGLDDAAGAKTGRTARTGAAGTGGFTGRTGTSGRIDSAGTGGLAGRNGVSGRIGSIFRRGMTQGMDDAGKTAPDTGETVTDTAGDVYSLSGGLAGDKSKTLSQTGVSESEKETELLRDQTASVSAESESEKETELLREGDRASGAESEKETELLRENVKEPESAESEKETELPRESVSGSGNAESENVNGSVSGSVKESGASSESPESENGEALLRGQVHDEEKWNETMLLSPEAGGDGLPYETTLLAEENSAGRKFVLIKNEIFINTAEYI